MLKIFYVSPEVAPFAITSNLAEIASSYSKHLKNIGHDIRVMMPNYKAVNERKYVLRDVIRLQGLQIKLGNEALNANGKSAFIPNSKVQIYFLDNKNFFDRDGFYNDPKTGEMFADNAKRFIFFSFGCLETLKLLYWQPDIIHCNNWQTAIIPMLLKTVYKDDSFFKNTKTLLTIHDFYNQGEFDDSISEFVKTDKPFLEKINSKSINFLHFGLEFSDLINSTIDMPPSTIENLQSLIKTKKKIKCPQIHQGIDTQLWNPETDKLIPNNYDFKNIGGKVANKQALLSLFNFDFSEAVPVFSIIINSGNSENLEQLLNVCEELIKFDLQLLVIFDRKIKTVGKLKELEEKYVKKIGFKFDIDDKMHHLVIAGSDLFLYIFDSYVSVSSILTCLAYGTIPILNRAMFSSIQFKNFDPVQKESGSIFYIDTEEMKEIVKVNKNILEYFKNKKIWSKIVLEAMKKDYSWDLPAQQYIKIYQNIISEKIRKN